MKYIRTKYGIYESEKVSHDDKYVYKYEVRPVWCVNQDQEEIINQADTIEKLCDEYVVVSYSTNKVMYQTKDYNYFWGIAKKDYINHFTIHNEYYGAIWVFDSNSVPTLKSVAKMNDKGELELL